MSQSLSEFAPSEKFFKKCEKLRKNEIERDFAMIIGANRP
jgi:hypothetical protein